MKISLRLVQIFALQLLIFGCSIQKTAMEYGEDSSSVENEDYEALKCTKRRRIGSHIKKIFCISREEELEEQRRARDKIEENIQKQRIE